MAQACVTGLNASLQEVRSTDAAARAQTEHDRRIMAQELQEVRVRSPGIRSAGHCHCV